MQAQVADRDSDELADRASAAMNRYADGDEGAFGEVYDCLAPRLYRFLVRQTSGDIAQSEDLVQQTFLHMHRARGSFLKGANVTPWAFAIARRLFIDGVRQKQRERVLLRDESIADSAVAERFTSEDGGESRQIGERITRALAALPEAQRTAFELVKRDGLSMAEAAQVLGTTPGAVKLRAHRAYEALRSALGDLYEQAERGGR